MVHELISSIFRPFSLQVSEVKVDGASGRIVSLIPLQFNTCNLLYSFKSMAVSAVYSQSSSVNVVLISGRVCLDTAHTLAAGYDIKTPEGFAETFRHFDEVIGFSYLRGMHLNDSKKDLGSRVDRHESIGKGLMGLDTFRMIMADPRFDNMPLILETPDEALWPEEIQLLYKQLKS